MSMAAYAQDWTESQGGDIGSYSDLSRAARKCFTNTDVRLVESHDYDPAKMGRTTRVWAVFPDSSRVRVFPPTIKG